MTAKFDASGMAAVVTGGGRGIGREVALKLAEAGADVAVLYRKRPEPAEEVRGLIAGMGRKALALACDVADAAAVDESFKKIKAEFGRIDVLVNNAGLASWGNFIADTTLEEWDRIIKADLYGPFNCIKAVLPTMREQRLGHVISVSSSITLLHPPTGGPYAVAKAGVEALTKVLAHEETSRNIRVNAVAPGLVETDMGRKLMHVDDLGKIASKMPFGRVCQPADLANLILFLISPEGSYIHGQVIYVNGGKIF